MPPLCKYKPSQNVSAFAHRMVYKERLSKIGFVSLLCAQKCYVRPLIIRLECLKVTSLKTPSATESVFNDFSLLGWRLCTVLSFPRRISLPLRGAVTVKPSVESGAL